MIGDRRESIRDCLGLLSGHIMNRKQLGMLPGKMKKRRTVRKRLRKARRGEGSGISTQ